MVAVLDAHRERSAWIVLRPVRTAPNPSQNVQKLRPLTVPRAAGEVHAYQSPTLLDEPLRIGPRGGPGAGHLPVLEMQQHRRVIGQGRRIEEVRVFDDPDPQAGVCLQNGLQGGCGLLPHMPGITHTRDQQKLRRPRASGNRAQPHDPDTHRVANQSNCARPHRSVS